METKHTKGEWTATQTSISDSNGVIATAYVNTVKRYIGKQEAEANAKLIAAAPDLLEALLAIRNYSNAFNECPPKMKDCINNAIKKATTWPNKPLK